VFAVDEVVVHGAETDATYEVVEGVGVYRVTCQYVADCEDADYERAVETAHGGYEEDWAVDGVYLWVLDVVEVRVGFVCLCVFA